MVVEMVEAAAAEEEKEEEPEEDPEEEEAQEADGPRTEALTIENRESFAHEMARLTNDGAPPAQDEEVSPGVETLREYLKYSDYGIKKMQDERKAGERILGEIEGGDRPMPAWYHEDFVEGITADAGQFYEQADLLAVSRAMKFLAHELASTWSTITSSPGMSR